MRPRDTHNNALYTQDLRIQGGAEYLVLWVGYRKEEASWGRLISISLHYSEFTRLPCIFTEEQQFLFMLL